MPSPSTDEPDAKKYKLTMTAWKLHSYNGLDSLKLVHDLPLPEISKPTDVLIQVKATSLNVLDMLMPDGYGRVVFGRFFGLRLPVTLGRDFAGVVKAVGRDVKHLKPGDQVMGVVPPQTRTGSHAQYVLVAASCVALKPTNLTMTEAASIPYAGLTAWTALRSGLTANLSDDPKSNKGKLVLILGAAGGVGSIALQLCKQWGCTVVATCSTGAVPAIENLGPESDHIIDYTLPGADDRLKKFGGFHVVLDLTGRREGHDLGLLKSWANAKYLTPVPPLMRNFDWYGVIGGFIKSAWDFITSNILPLLRWKSLRWVLFKHDEKALIALRDYAQNGQLKPVIDSVFPFEKVPEAYAKMKDGHTRGKIVIEITE